MEGKYDSWLSDRAFHTFWRKRLQAPNTCDKSVKRLEGSPSPERVFKIFPSKILIQGLRRGGRRGCKKLMSTNHFDLRRRRAVNTDFDCQLVLAEVRSSQPARGALSVSSNISINPRCSFLHSLLLVHVSVEYHDQSCVKLSKAQATTCDQS